MDAVTHWNCGAGRSVIRRAVTVEAGCDEFFHEDDGSVCRHIKAPAPPQQVYVADVLREKP